MTTLGARSIFLLSAVNGTTAATNKSFLNSNQNVWYNSTRWARTILCLLRTPHLYPKISIAVTLSLPSKLIFTSAVWRISKESSIDSGQNLYLPSYSMQINKESCNIFTIETMEKINTWKDVAHDICHRQVLVYQHLQAIFQLIKS